MNWDADLRFTTSGWAYHIFRGDRWCGLHNADRRNYLRNAYRVLLTRARQGSETLDALQRLGVTGNTGADDTLASWFSIAPTPIKPAK